MTDVDFIFKIAAIGIIVAVLNQVLIRAGDGCQSPKMLPAVAADSGFPH